MNSIKKKIGSILLIATLFIITSCNDEQKTEKPISENNEVYDSVFRNKTIDTTQLKNDKKFLDEFKEKHWKHHDLWGGFLVARNGKIIYEIYSGYLDKDNKIKNNPNGALHIASISKVLTATLILKLIEKKNIDLDQSIQSILPDFPYPEITIKMLLNHRSGLIKYADFASNKKIWKKDSTLLNNDILCLLSDYKPKLYFKPDTKFTYSNTNFAILALIIEKITQMDYPKAMVYYIFKPLGMKNSFVYTKEKAYNTAKSYYNDGIKPFENDYLDFVYGDKNIYSTPRDLLKFDVALYSDKFLSKELKEIAFKGYSYEERGVKNYGLGIRMMEWQEGEKILYHNGWWHGNNTVYIHQAKDSISIIALGNKFSNKLYDAFDLIGYFGGYPKKLEL